MTSRFLSRSLSGSLQCLRQSTLSASCWNTSRCAMASTSKSKWHGLWEPDDLKMEPDIPELSAIQVRMKGFDFPVLESYARHVHRIMDIMFKLDADAWPAPAKCTQLRTFHSHSTNVHQRYDLQKYERVVMAEDIPTTTLPVLVQFIQKTCPAGVEVSVKEPDSDEDEVRYVPDYGVLELEAEKKAIIAGKKKKKR